MANDSKLGPLNVDDLLKVWVAATDKAYNQGFLQAGEGGGLEAYTQAFAQFARVSEACDVTSQAMYILPWSGQTNPPAAGEAQATVTLTLSRTLGLQLPLLIGAGQVFFEETTNDWGENGPVEVQTGRRYTLQQDFLFLPGEAGPFDVPAIAERVGWGYNNPFPGTITGVIQPGKGFQNALATVTVASGQAPPTPPPPNLVVSLIAANEADMFVPDHVGQYVLLTQGANAGKIARMVSFSSPVLPNGSTVGLEMVAVVEAYSAPGAFRTGEQIQIKAGATVVGFGRFLAQRSAPAGHQRIGFVLLSGTLAQGNTLTGQLSGAVATADLILFQQTFVAEAPPPGTGTGGASWTVLDWVNDFGLACTNAAKPTGGRLGMLDAIGFDRKLPRLQGEDDETYRQRIWQIADKVTPNAVKRTLNRVLGSIPWCFREVGGPLLPGFYYDREDEQGDFYDYDTLTFTVTSPGSFVDPMAASGFQERVEWRSSAGDVKLTGWFGRLAVDQLTVIRWSGVGTRPLPSVAAGDVIVGLASGATANVSTLNSNPAFSTRRFQFYLDYTEFRAFFMVGVPKFGLGEFGFAYDNHPYDAYDASPFDDFYDGFPVGNESLYKRVAQALDDVRAGGVTFDLYLEDGSCT